MLLVLFWYLQVQYVHLMPAHSGWVHAWGRCDRNSGGVRESIFVAMADGMSDDDVIHLASFNTHRSQGM